MESPQKRQPLRVVDTEKYFSIIKQMLTDNGQAFVRVTGNSMYPLLHHLRDGVILVPPSRVRSGDIVLFDRRNGRYALHRVIGMGKNGFTMAGDNQWHMERNLPCEQIVGVVSAICRDGKEIPVERFFLKIYFQGARLLAWPRIYGCRAAIKLLRPLKRAWDKAETPAREEK